MTWKLAEDQMDYEYRIRNDINRNNEFIFTIQRREIEHHHIGDWKNYSLKVFHDKEEAEKVLKHLKGI